MLPVRCHARDIGGHRERMLSAWIVEGANVTDRVVIITGGSRGIGRATALAAAARGFRVVRRLCQQRGGGRKRSSPRSRRKNGKAIAVKCDVGEESDILALFKAADEFGTLGALVNNAGIVGTSGVRVDEMSAERIQRMMAVNVTGSILCAREAVKRMSTQTRRQGRRHRQPVLGRGEARRAQHLCRLCGLQGRDRFLHHRPRP